MVMNEIGNIGCWVDALLAGHSTHQRFFFLSQVNDNTHSGRAGGGGTNGVSVAGNNSTGVIQPNQKRRAFDPTAIAAELLISAGYATLY